jgi:hypothetical protein
MTKSDNIMVISEANSFVKNPLKLLVIRIFNRCDIPNAKPETKTNANIVLR